MTTPKYSCPECSEYLGNGHRAACSRYSANQVKYPTKDWHDEVLGKASRILSSDPRKWEAEAKAANEKLHTLIVHPKFLLDLLHSLDATRRENEDLKSRFAEAMKKLKG
jgi:hypothetical protein